jgi:hypothetical protein
MDPNEKKPGTGAMGTMWILLISLWAAVVYILWFINLIGDFAGSRGGW